MTAWARIAGVGLLAILAQTPAKSGALVETIDAQAESFNPRRFKVTIDGSVK
jgi:hypothetical protein